MLTSEREGVITYFLFRNEAMGVSPGIQPPFNT